MIPDAFVGAWQRHSIALDGGRPSEPATVIWVQGHSAYADLRVPLDGSRAVESFAGHTTWEPPRLRWSHDIDLAGGPAALTDVGVVEWDGGDLIESGTFVIDGADVPYVEVWRRLPGSDGRIVETTEAGYTQVAVGEHELTVVDGRGAGEGFSACYRRSGQVVLTTGAVERKARRWEAQAWPELANLRVAGEGEVGLVPVGATEQHGPHLPTGTDTIIATALCERVSARTGAPVLPAIPVACSYGHGTQLPGTLSLTPELLAAVTRQYAEWAATSGLTKLLFVNSHFGNAAALGIATDHLRLFRPDLQVGVCDWWSSDPFVQAETVLEGDDVHAHRAETSLMLVLAPDLVHLDRLETSDDPDRTGGLVFRYTAPALSTNGVTGRPSEATFELGEILLERTVTALVARVERGRVEKPPLGPSPRPPLTTPPPHPHPLAF
jgi:creatinine amidohydrolase